MFLVQILMLNRYQFKDSIYHEQLMDISQISNQPMKNAKNQKSL